MDALTWFVIIGITLIFLVIIIFIYNRFVKNRNRVNNAWSDIDVHLKKRYDLIPGMIETVRKFANHEKKLFENLALARNNCIEAKSFEAQNEAEMQLNSLIKSVFVVAENYPLLKSDIQFLEFQKTIGMIEDDIENSRRYYNAVVREYNTTIETFPSLIFAGIFGFRKEKYFEINPNEKSNLKISFE